MIQAQSLASRFGMGISVIKDNATADEIDLGPLRQLKGKWVGRPFMGWNVITVPDKKFFALEVVPYEEVLTFTPVVVAINRGPIENGAQVTQHITGLIYEQVITSVCTTEQCISRGLGAKTSDNKPNIIHAETGLFLNLQDQGDGFSFARLSTIPHGNAVLALGNTSNVVPPSNDFFDKASILPTIAGEGSFPGMGYDEGAFIAQQFPNQFDQTDPNTFLRKTLGNHKLIEMTTIDMSTQSDTGGILNIPFINSNVKANFMTARFWIQRIADPSNIAGASLQLQYTQTINLVFPAGGTKAPMINWPHVTVATLHKVSDTLSIKQAL